MNTIPIKTTDLTITVINPKKEIHYYTIVKNIALTEVHKYRSLLDSLGCIYSYNTFTTSVAIIIYEPNASVADILLYNMEYFAGLNILETDLFEEPALIGDLAFWGHFTLKERIFIRHLFSSLTMLEIGNQYFMGEKWVDAKKTEILKIIAVKYPSAIDYTRKSFRILGISLLVHVPEKCRMCNNPL